MTSIEAPRVTAAMIVAGLWLRIMFGAAFTALAAPWLVARDALRAGDGLALFAIGAALAWIGWRRARVALGVETPAPGVGVAAAR
jgi:hypothetical protein